MTIEKIYAKLEELLEEEKVQEAENFLCEQLEDAKEKEEYGIYISAANELMGLYRNVAKYQEAFNIAEDVALLMEELHLEGTEYFGTTLLNTALIYNQAGAFSASLEYYRRALKIYEDVLPKEDERFMGIYHNIAGVYENLGETENALMYREKMAAVAKNLKDAQVEYATALSGMGESYYAMGDAKKALDVYKKALMVIEENYGRNQSYEMVLGNINAITRMSEQAINTHS